MKKPEQIQRDIRNIDKTIHKRADDLAKLKSEAAKQHMLDQLTVLDNKRDDLLEELARYYSEG